MPAYSIKKEGAIQFLRITNGNDLLKSYKTSFVSISLVDLQYITVKRQKQENINARFHKTNSVKEQLKNSLVTTLTSLH